jgi:hypothetical protein
VQGEKMNNFDLNIVDSILEIKASGNLNITEDLQKPEGKSIAQLIYEQKKEENNESK